MTYLKRLFVLLSFVGLLTQYSCYSTAVVPSVTVTGDTRTLVLDGEFVSEKSARGFTCWYCKDYINGGKTLIEVGIMGSSPKNGYNGFILYDGGYEGKMTFYYRDGINHRWDWGKDVDGTFDYSFVLKTDGTGSYYDFSSVKAGESKKPSQLFKCYKRK